MIDKEGNPINEEIKINEPIKPGETKKHTLSWIPSEIGETQIAFRVKTDADGDDKNNISSSINVNIQSSSVFETQMGQSQGLANIPFAHDNKGPINTQSIYTRKEINSLNGLIKEMTWFTEGIEVMPVEMDIKIYLANTDKENMSDGEIPLEKMSLVYTGKMRIENAKQKEIKISLDNTFLYEGKNLAVHVTKASQSGNYGFRGGFCFYRENGNTTPTIYFDNFNRKSVKDFKPVLRLKLNSSGNKLSGKVTDTDGNPLQEAEVFIPSLGMKATTNQNGEYTYDLVNQGEYEIKFSKRGYYEEVTTIKIPETANTPVVKDISLKKMETCNLEFKVTNPAGTPIKGAKVAFEGYDPRTDETDSEGKVTLKDFVRDNYSVSVEAKDYQKYSAELNLKGNNKISETCQLLPETYPIADLNLNPENGNMTWSEPVRINNVRYDNGTIAARCGLSEDETSEYAVFGMKVEETGTIKNIKWYLYGNPGEKNREVNLYVFYMAEDGYPEKEPVYTKKGIISELNKWFEYKLEENFKAEKEFFVALSCTKSYLGLGIDSGSENGEYPWREKGYFFTSDYRSHYYYASIWYRGNFMIRLSMTDLNTDALQTLPLVEGYNIYRLKYEDIENKDKWVTVSTKVNDTFFTDKEYETLPQGYYLYGITSQWKGAGESDVEFSNLIEKDMMTKVIVKVTSNIDGANILDGTEIRLTSKTGEKTYSSKLKDGNKSCVIENVEKGSYILTIINARFDVFSQEVSPNKENEYTFGEYKLIESLKEPVNLIVEEDKEKEGVYTIEWNNTTSILEDFESHKNFALNSPGKFGWTYIDNDDNESTYGLSIENKRLEYDNWGARTAYIIFNPSATNPRSDSSAELSPWSGDKFLGSFSASTGANDDLIISPELFFNEDFTFSFYAKSYTTQYGADRMMVGYSETEPEIKSFKWIQEGEYTIMLSRWEQYKYVIPASAKYVCIRCISDNAFLFMVDDIQIGEEESKPYSTFAKSYEIYLDNKMLGTTGNCNYTVNAGKGPHTIGIKAIYETGKSEMTTVKVGESESSITETDSPSVTYADRKLIFNGMSEKISVYSVSGNMVRNYANIENLVDLNDLETGFYIATVIMNGKEYVVKFIIEQ